MSLEHILRAVHEGNEPPHNYRSPVKDIPAIYRVPPECIRPNATQRKAGSLTPKVLVLSESSLKKRGSLAAQSLKKKKSRNVEESP